MVLMRVMVTVRCVWVVVWRIVIVWTAEAARGGQRVVERVVVGVRWDVR